MLTNAKRSIKQIHVHHGKFELALNKLENCYSDSLEGYGPRGVAILGRSGTGKTHLLNYFRAKYESRREETGLKIPVLYTKTVSKPTVKGLAENLLHAMKDPLADKGTEYGKTNRLKKLMKAAEVKVLILDEFQHFVDKSSKKVQFQVADWLKVLVEDTGVGLVVAGLPYCSSVILSNEQLSRRFSSPLVMPQFNWLASQDRNNFKGVLKAIQNTLVEIEMPDLSSDEMAFRFYCATGGIIGRVANIFTQLIVDLENEDGKKRVVELPDLNKAAKQACFDMPLGIDNPFSKELKVKPNPETVNQIMNVADERGVDGDRMN